jgi:hypothetical protein
VNILAQIGSMIQLCTPKNLRKFMPVIRSSTGCAETLPAIDSSCFLFTLPDERPSVAGASQGQSSLLHGTVLSTLARQRKYDAAAYKFARYISKPFATSRASHVAVRAKKHCSIKF